MTAATQRPNAASRVNTRIYRTFRRKAGFSAEETKIRLMRDTHQILLGVLCASPHLL
jgi:hypothetical protein